MGRAIALCLLFGLFFAGCAAVETAPVDAPPPEVTKQTDSVGFSDLFGQAMYAADGTLYTIKGNHRLEGVRPDGTAFRGTWTKAGSNFCEYVDSPEDGGITKACFDVSVAPGKAVFASEGAPELIFKWGDSSVS